MYDKRIKIHTVNLFKQTEINNIFQNSSEVQYYSNNQFIIPYHLTKTIIQSMPNGC